MATDNTGGRFLLNVQDYDRNPVFYAVAAISGSQYSSSWSSDTKIKAQVLQIWLDQEPEAGCHLPVPNMLCIHWSAEVQRVPSRRPSTEPWLWWIAFNIEPVWSTFSDSCGLDSCCHEHNYTINQDNRMKCAWWTASALFFQFFFFWQSGVSPSSLLDEAAAV